MSARNPVKCPNSAQPVECPVCAEFNEVSGLRHAKVSRDFARAMDSAVEKSGNLFGDNLQDSRVNNAARGDGMAVIGMTTSTDGECGGCDAR